MICKGSMGKDGVLFHADLQASLAHLLDAPARICGEQLELFKTQGIAC